MHVHFLHCTRCTCIFCIAPDANYNYNYNYNLNCKNNFNSSFSISLRAACG